MVTFLDGPAAAQSLMLRRCPYLLRVTRDASGKWDACDQLNDEPLPGEKIFVYMVTEKPTVVHISCRPRSASGWYQMARYRLCPVQPHDEEARDTAKWRAWCEAHRSLFSKPASEDPNAQKV